MIVGDDLAVFGHDDTRPQHLLISAGTDNRYDGGLGGLNDFGDRQCISVRDRLIDNLLDILGVFRSLSRIGGVSGDGAD
ncbi:hypothetical protein SDC9_186433 [bioreactor metagenome]|uniref:Uncharacterized protein n=1 Tax=bioreactor metagenome TaxID=1076179 RepID=A0A645HIR8_9ZZZZ